MQAQEAEPASVADLKARFAKGTTDLRDAIRLEQQALARPAIPATDKLWLLSRLSIDLRLTRQFDEALRVARQGQHEAGSQVKERVHFGTLASLTLHEAERDQEARAEFEKIAPLLKGLAKASQDRASLVEVANAWRVGGAVLSTLGKLPEAMDLLVQSLRIYDELKDQVYDQSECINEIAFIHFKSGRLDAALREQQRAIDLAEHANVRDSLSRLYLRKAHFLSSLKRVDEQYQVLVSARALARDEKNEFNLAVIATNLADVALQRKDYPAALQFAEEAIPLAEKTKDRESLLVCWINKGIALNRLGRPEGLAWIRKAIDEFSADPLKLDIAADVQGVLSEELAFNKEYEQAYLAAVDHKRRSDAVRNTVDQKRIAEADAAYQADKKQRQIESLQQEQRSQARLQMLWILAGALALTIIVVLLISRLYLKRAYRTVRDMSLRDPLTGLRNRRYLAHRIDEDLAQIRRQHSAHTREHGDTPLENADVIFIMIDMDHFKSVNDEHGHPAGDAVLKQFSAVLLHELRDSDTVVRWGGEEFLIVAKQSTGVNVDVLVERIRASVERCAFDLGNGLVLRKTCSIGFAGFPFPGPDVAMPKWEDVVELADQCLYAAKSSGRNAWVGIVPCDPVGALPVPPDARAAVEDATFRLLHSESREICWPK